MPNAIMKIINGQMQYVDQQTGQHITNPAGYNVIQSEVPTLADLGLDPINSSPAQPAQPSVPQKLLQDNFGHGNGGLGGQVNAPSQGQERSQANNFGYKEKPGLVGLASMAPGPLGMAGAAVNAGWNVSNAKAIDDAKTSMGLHASSGFRDTLHGLVKDDQGQVGKYGIGNNVYDVGLEAMSPEGTTNLTPGEARARSMANPNNIQDLSDETKFAQPKDDSSFLGDFSKHTKGFFDSIFGDDTDVATGYQSRYPDRPTAPQASATPNKSMQAAVHEKAMSQYNGGRGFSQATKDAVSKAPGGLY